MGVFTCTRDDCRCTFNKIENLKRHEAGHAVGKKFLCTCSFDGCGRTFTRVNNLNRHEEGHTAAKPFVCTKCMKTFKRRDAQRRHENNCRVGEYRASLEKPFCCSKCSKGFKRRQAVKPHERICRVGDRESTIVKELYCGKCDKSFARSDNVQRHDEVCQMIAVLVNDVDTTPYTNENLLVDELTTSSYMEHENLLLDHTRMYLKNVETGRMVADILDKGVVLERAIPQEYINARDLWIADSEINDELY